MEPNFEFVILRMFVTMGPTHRFIFVVGEFQCKSNSLFVTKLLSLALGP